MKTGIIGAIMTIMFALAGMSAAWAQDYQSRYRRHHRQEYRQDHRQDRRYNNSYHTERSYYGYRHGDRRVYHRHRSTFYHR